MESSPSFTGSSGGLTIGAGQAGSVNAKAPSVDEEVREYVQSRLNEAAERITFHRTEVERWERIARACGVALVQVDAVEPVAGATPDHFIPTDVPKQAIR